MSGDTIGLGESSSFRFRLKVVRETRIYPASPALEIGDGVKK